MAVKGLSLGSYSLLRKMKLNRFNFYPKKHFLLEINEKTLKNDAKYKSMLTLKKPECRH